MANHFFNPGEHCPYYDRCTERLGEDLEDGHTCNQEGFIDTAEGLCCLAWDIIVPEKKEDKNGVTVSGNR
jgi:hypothetical protein